MRRLLTGYAINFNHRHQRSGHLFQNRYKSIICQKDVYFLELIRYIHLNPLRAQIVSDLDALDGYPWSGHAVLMGRGKLPGQVVDEAFNQFGTQLSDARKNYRQFVADGIAQGNREELVGGGLRRSEKGADMAGEFESFDDRVLGSSTFVEALRQDVKLNKKLPKTYTLSEIQKVVCKLFGVEADVILRRTRMSAASEARAIFCYIATRLFWIKGKEVGRFLAIGPAGVSRAITRGEQLLRDRQKLKTEIHSLLSQ